MRKVLLCLCLVPVLAACQDRSQPVEPGRARDERPAPAAPAPAAPLDETPDFVGAWAARPELCGNGGWMFTPQGLRTAGEVNCSWTRVEKTDQGYGLTGSCSSEGQTEPAEVTLTLDPNAPRAMTVAGGPWAAPVPLIRCDGAAAAPASAG